MDDHSFNTARFMVAGAIWVLWHTIGRVAVLEKTVTQLTDQLKKLQNKLGDKKD